MKVFTYYEPTNTHPEAGWLLHAWEKNWRGAGFKPVVLTLQDAAKHPRFRELDAVFASFPTVNPSAFERACWRRWCAYALVTGICVDFDLFNIGMKPFEPAGLVFWDRSRVPAAVSGRPEDFSTVLDWFTSYKMDIDDHYNGRPHLSDQMICTRHREVDTRDEVREYGEMRPGGTLLHISNDSCGGSKRRAIERYFGV